MSGGHGRLKLTVPDGPDGFAATGTRDRGSAGLGLLVAEPPVLAEMKEGDNK